MKKTNFKKLFIFAFIILTIVFVYNLFKIFTTDKQIIYITTSKQISTDGTVEAIVGVNDKKTNKSIKSKIKVEMRDENNKKVKNFKEIYQIEEGERANISIPLPENISTGTYTLKFISQAGLKYDKKDVKISITDKDANNIVISLDKGIYKPGDDINYRALLISKNNDTPKNDDVEISIFDANQNRVYINKATTSEFGIVSGKFTLADEVNSGEYKITVSTKSYKAVKNFTVNPYVIPNFEVNLENLQDTYKVGDIANIKINARYFFGEPVVNATIKGSINNVNFTGLTNPDGIFELNKDIKDAGKYDLKVQVIDSSNYLIESEKTFYATNNAFEVEIIPENENLIKGIDNKIYFITKTINGEPVKTHISVNIDDLTRQIVTDDSGIGVLTLNSNDISKLNNQTSINATATNMNDETVYCRYDTTIEKYQGTVISLDNLKYKENDDITIYLDSTTDVTNREIYICKNGNLLKVISTDLDKVTFNLEDVYGLVDIYTKNSIDNNYYGIMPISSYLSTKNNYFKKTIFISPEKALNIEISKDKEEYKPGEKLNLSIKTETEKGEAIDTGLLVSILDEAVLSLAENDLSIDNIKLALEDIQLSDGITLADLYAEVLDSTAENKLRVALLRQSTESPNIVQVNTQYSNNKDNYISRAIILGAILIISLFLYFSIKHSKLKSIMVTLINLVTLFIVLYASTYEFLYYDCDFSSIAVIITSAVLSIVLYVVLLYKIKVWIFNCIINLAILPGILLFAIQFASLTRFSNLLPVVILLLPPVIMAILVVISRSRTLNKFFDKIKELSIQCSISEGIYLLLYILISMLNINNAVIALFITLILYWIAQKIYVANTEQKENEKMEIDNVSGFIFIGIAIGFIIFGFLYLYNSSTNSINNATQVIEDFDYSTNNEGTYIDSMKVSPTLSFDGVSPSNSKNDTQASIPQEETSMTETDEATTEKVESNVRKIFLESLAFIPELVSTNGKAETAIDISDNITTWNIQAIGNTKDGRIGYNSSTFKVFKEFFIDFSMPTNSVVTDKTNIPVTVYNYTDNELKINLKVKENDWSNIGSYENSIDVLANSTKLVYIPIEILKAGEHTLRIEANSNEFSDIVEKKTIINTNGFKKEKVVSSGSTEKKLTLDHFTTETAIENTRKLKVKLYPSVISQTIEGMENIFAMPTGCFEQTSSSLYPNILALKYLEDTGLNDTEIKEKAIDYISKGYQRILTFETSQKGGYSLYGDDPAENVLTAFGLMELNDLKSVYDIDEKITNNMVDYLFNERNLDGSFDINSTYIGSASSTDNLAMNAYIIWALSEVCPEDARLNKSVEYLEKKLNTAKDNYTIALMANVFSNTKNSLAKDAINKLMESVVEDAEGGAYIASKVKDYWGTYGRCQNIQTTALTSMVLTKEKNHTATNNALLQYIIGNKDTRGTWNTTQATILALKAINTANSNENISNQKILVTVNDLEKDIEIKDSPLDLYSVTFDNIKDENKISLELQKGNIYYEIIEEYYVEYESLEQTGTPKIKVTQKIDDNVNVNDIIKQIITVTNLTGDEIRNGLVQISIPQGCTVNEASLSKLKHLGFIEKYEYNYSTINLYIRNFKDNYNINLEIEYRANYPEEITGGLVRAYDYYNPSNEGVVSPVKIFVK